MITTSNMIQKDNTQKFNFNRKMRSILIESHAPFIEMNKSHFNLGRKFKRNLTAGMLILFCGFLFLGIAAFTRRQPFKYTSSNWVKLAPLSSSSSNHDQDYKYKEIPKQLYFTWITKTEQPQSLKMQLNMKRWEILNPDWNIKLFGGLWNDSEQHTYMKQKCPKYYAAWDAILDPIAAKCDIFRYCLLFNEGGVWSDVDVEPWQGLDDFIEHDIDLLVVHDGGLVSYGDEFLANGFFAVTAGHPVMKRALEIVEEHYQMRMNWKGAIWVTGPSVLWRAVNDTQYAVKHKRKVQHMYFDGDIIQSEDDVIVLRGKYDGHSQDAVENGGELHGGRNVTWKN